MLDTPDGPETVARFRSALVRAAECINADPAAYREIMKKLRLLPKDADGTYEMVRFDMKNTPAGLPSSDDIKAFAEWMKAQGILKGNPAYEDVVFP